MAKTTKTTKTTKDEESLLVDVTQEQINVFVLNAVADRMLYTTGVDFDPRSVLAMMDEMGVRIQGFELDIEKFSSMLEDTLELGYIAADQAAREGKM